MGNNKAPSNGGSVPHPFEPGFNRHQVKEILGVQESTFWNLIRTGKLKGYYVGEQIRVEPVELQRYIDQGKARFRAKYGQPGTDTDQKGGVANG